MYQVILPKTCTIKIKPTDKISGMFNTYSMNIHVLLHFEHKQDAQLGIESVGHIGKDSNNNNRSK